MANDRPENTDVLRTGDEHDEALVTYEQPGAPGSARGGGLMVHPGGGGGPNSCWLSADS